MGRNTVLSSVPVPGPLLVLDFGPSCPSLYWNWSHPLYLLYQVGQPCSPIQLCPWTPPGLNCIVYLKMCLLVDSVTGLQAS